MNNNNDVTKNMDYSDHYNDCWNLYWLGYIL